MMKRIINVFFSHPIDGRSLHVELDAFMTSKEAISELVSAGVMPSETSYILAVKGGKRLEQEETFQQANVEEGDIIRILICTEAG